MSFQFKDREASRPSILLELEAQGKPFLATVAALMLQQQMMPRALDQETVHAFAGVNPGQPDVSALRGAALAFSSDSRREAWAVGRLAPGSPYTSSAQQWQTLFSSRAGTRYDHDLLSGAREEFLREGSPWTLAIRMPLGGLPSRPMLISPQETGVLAAYDPVSASMGSSAMYTIELEQLSNAAAHHRNFGLLAIRVAEPELYGAVAHALV